MRYQKCIALLVIPLLLWTCSNFESISIIRLKCEYLNNPVGIDTPQPCLSWVLQSNRTGQKQTAYQILVASSREKLNKDVGDFWDTGKIDSDSSIHITYRGQDVKSRKRLYWKVRVWDVNNVPSAWSDIAYWEMGLLKPNDWSAQWIGAPEDLMETTAAPYFRKEFQVRPNLKKARVYICGLGYYELYINGNKVGDHVLSPHQTNYDRRQNESWRESRIGHMSTRVLYETFDVTDFIHAGTNVIAVLLGAGWYRQNDRLADRSLWYDSPRLIAQLEMGGDDGTSIVLSDDSWRTAASPIIHNGVFTGENYDARLEEPGWNQPDCDDGDWNQAIIVRPPQGKLYSQMAPPDRMIKTIRPVSMSTLENNVYRFDLGQMISGWAQLKLSGAEGTRITLKYVEELGPTYGQTDTYILKGSCKEIWEPRFTWHAFRYVDVTSPIPLTINNLNGRVVNSDVDTTGYFECSNSLFNRILTNYRWTQLGNMHGGVPSDCPHRERRGYTGDGQISSIAAIYNFDMASFYTKWLDDISDAQNGVTGYVPNTAPYQDGGGGTAWGSAIVIIPWNMYVHYGDEQILRRHYAGMKKWIKYLNSQRFPDGLLQDQGLGEWVPPDPVELPTAFVNTCYFYHNLDLMIRIASILNFERDFKYYQTLRDKVAGAVQKEFYNEENHTYATGSQGANSFPLAFGLAPDSIQSAAVKQLVHHIKSQTRGHFDTGILATPLQLDVLSKFGHHDLSYTLMNQRDFPGYGYMLSKGATTIWETWQGDQSHSHPMFGSVCQWFYRNLAGIQPDEKAPGFKHIFFKPQPVSELSFVKASYNSPYGLIKSCWEIVDNDFFLDVYIPVNTTATVYIPAASAKDVRVKGKNTKKHIQFLGNHDNSVTFNTGSGRYQFISKNATDIMPRPMLSAPTITPGDTLVLLPDSVLVNISSENKNVDIHYSLDNSEPKHNDPRFISPFYVTRNTLIKAKCFKQGYEPGYTKTSMIDFIHPQNNGLNYRYYRGKWTRIPDMGLLEPQFAGTVFQFGLHDINFPDEEFALRFEGMMQIHKEGDYTFYTRSNDGSRLYIDDKLVVDNDGLHGPEEQSGMIDLPPGCHSIRVDYFQAGGGMFLNVFYSGPETIKQQIPPCLLFRDD